MINFRHPRYTALTAATLILAVNFWAWSLISPLATEYAKEFALSPLKLAFLVAAPVLVGSIGRIPLGLLADRFGGRRMFAVICWLSVLAVIGLRFAGDVPSLLAAAVGLGIAGASFAAGVPFVNAWFPKQQRGLALGIYTLGDAGTAVAGLLSPWLITMTSRPTLFYIVAALLFISGILILACCREAPSWRPAKGSSWQRLKQAAAWKLTWRLGLIYSITFGALIALGMYLPVLLNQSYDLTPTDAAARAAGFVLLSTFVRPIGGWLSDRLNGLLVIRASFLLLVILAALAAAELDLGSLGTVAYLGLAAVLGIASGAIFAIIGHRTPARLVGAVTGLVGAAGAIGGYFPPLIMGLSFEYFGSYSAALLLLAGVGLIILLNLGRLFSTIDNS